MTTIEQRHRTPREIAVLRVIASTPGIHLDNIAAVLGYSPRAVRGILNVLQSHEEATQTTDRTHSLTAKGIEALA
ncbi:hypothetical protein R3P93_08890 [Rhodococcus cerastii]|uniref:MarR family transcriptional regulator n=1 Tax=Rhodococcus cerastii TaxID=908616 RepID=A0ABU4D021_9NOCA|nr:MULTISPECIES: hypothetical protein [Rhodococcus]MDJ0003316.1 hypothetical protein [Rhodococcus fascians]MDV6302672.1 hypothetical protein [Rhodococcus cerastii]